MKNKLLLILMFGIFMLSFTSAIEWDNYYTYDESTRTATFKNGLTFGSKIAEIKLNTPLDMKVAVGYNYVFELETWGDVDYSDFVRGIYVHDKKKGFRQVARNIDLKYFNGYETKYRPINGCINEEFSKNGTRECIEYGIVRTEEYQVEVWDDLLPRDLRKNDHLIVRGYTNVEIGDKMEWYIDFFGAGKNTGHGTKGVKEWATWTAALNIDLTLYYKLNETSGNANDSIGVNDGIAAGITYGNPGIINNSFTFLTDAVGRVTTTNNIGINGSASRSISFWTNQDAVAGGANWIFQYGENTNLKGFGMFMLSNGDLQFWGASTGDFDTGFTMSLDTTYHIVVTYDGTDVRVYVNGSIEATVTKALDTTDSTLKLGVNSGGTNNMDGWIDEFAIWNRTLNASSVLQLYNNGTGITFTDTFETITVTLNEPQNNTILSDSLVEFNWTITPENLNITNWTLSVFFDNGTLLLQEINTTINTNLTTTVLHNETISDGDYIWNVESCGVDGDDVCDLSGNRTFSIDTLTPLVNITSPLEGFIVTEALQNITINFTISDSGGTLDQCWLNTSLNSTPVFLVCTDNVTSILYPASAPDNLTLFLSANDTASNTGITNVTIFKSQIAPEINITAPTGIFGFNLIGGIETLNVTFNSSSLDTCWFDYNGTNITIDGCISGIENSTQFILEENNFNMTVYANDTLGNENSSFTSWSYFVFENSQTFNSETTEGSTELFLINYTANEIPTSINFIYNGTLTSADIDATNFPIIIGSESIVIPNVDSNINLSFFWNIVSTSSNINITSNNQTVNVISLDNCSSFTNVLFNYTMVDEATQLVLDGATQNVSLEVDIVIFDSSRTFSIINFSTEFSGTNSNSICSLTNLLNGSTFSLDSTAKYSSADRQIEYHNIRNFEIDNSTTVQNITLFDILISESTEFQITFKNSDFVVVEGALIQVNRQYVSEGVFKTVELPITDSNGQTVVHLVQNSVVYNYIVTKNNEVIGTFNNLVAFCDDASIGQCFILLNALQGTTPAFNPDVGSGITVLSPTFNDTTRDLSFMFTTNDGSVRTILLTSIKMDQIGNTSVCSTSITSSSGTLTCNVPASIGNETIIVTIFVDGLLSSTSYFKAANDIELGVSGVFLMLFLVISLAMMFSESKSMIIVGVILGFVTGGILFFIQGGIIGGGSAVMWLIIMGIIMIWKLNAEGQT